MGHIAKAIMLHYAQKMSVKWATALGGMTPITKEFFETMAKLLMERLI